MYFFLAAVLSISMFIIVAGGLKLVTDLVGFLYPAYMSFKAIENASTDATQWLTYWVVFSVIGLTEGVFPFITGLIPFYFPMKVGIIVWLYHPKTQGAEVVYNQILLPYLLPYLEMTKTKKAEEKAD